METCSPPSELQQHRWHQLKAGHVIERMKWMSFREAIASGHVHDRHPEVSGFWIRQGVPLTSEAMYQVGWRYLRACTVDAPQVISPATVRMPGQPRCIDSEPYSPDEQRVVDWLIKRTSGAVGAGDDPIGFLLASYEMLADSLHADPMREIT